MILTDSSPKQPKNLDLSYKTDLDFWDCFGGEKTSYSSISMTDLHIQGHFMEEKNLPYSQINMVVIHKL